MNRSKQILIILLGILGLCVVYAYLAMPRLEKAPPRPERSEQAAVAVVQEAGEGVADSQRVSLEGFHADPEPFLGTERDIFNFKRRRVPAPVVVPPARPVESRPPEVVVKPVLPTPAEVMQRALGKFTFLGFLDKGGEKTVFLSSGNSLFTVKRGERFGVNQEFLVAEITDKSLTVERTTDGQEMTVPLIEKQQLTPTISSPSKVERSTGFAGQPQMRRVMPRRQGVRRVVPGNNVLPEPVDVEFPEEVEEELAPEEGDIVEGESNVIDE